MGLPYPKFTGKDTENIETFLKMLKFAHQHNNPGAGDDADQQICCTIVCRCRGEAADFLATLLEDTLMSLTSLEAALRKKFPVLSKEARNKCMRLAIRYMLVLKQGSLSLEEYIDKAMELERDLEPSMRPWLAGIFCEGLVDETIQIKERQMMTNNINPRTFDDMVANVRIIDISRS